MREGIDRAVDGLRDTLKEMRSRATVQAEDLEDALVRADENARRELGRVAVRAQRTNAALTDLTREIRARKAELAAEE